MVATGSGRWVVGAAVALAVIVFVVPMLVAGLFVKQVSESGCNGGTGQAGGLASPLAEDAIPSELMALFDASERWFGVPWNVLAAINKVETDFGRNVATSSAGAIGWMQFMPATWARYGVDGNDDGRTDPYDPEDAIPGAANYLRASGAPQDLNAAILAYNHAEWYVAEVMSWARRFAQGPTLAAPFAIDAGTCALGDAGVPGKVTVAPGANVPGKPITPETLWVLRVEPGAVERARMVLASRLVPALAARQALAVRGARPRERFAGEGAALRRLAAEHAERLVLVPELPSRDGRPNHESGRAQRVTSGLARFLEAPCRA